jgi:tetratricopeptide (TPR) repeat protein/DNA-binding CsgD family transcriptional regulator
MTSQTIAPVEPRPRLAGTDSRSDRLDQLLAECDALIRGEPEAALPLATEALAIARALGDDHRTLRALFGVANSHRMLGRYDRALVWLKKCAALLDKLPDDPHRRGRINGAIGMICYETGDHEGVTGYLTLALEDGRRAGDIPGILGALVVLGELALQRAEYSRAFELLLEGVELAGELDSPYALAPALKNLARAYDLIGDFNAALDAHSRSLELYRSIGDRLGEAAALSYLGGVVTRMGNPERGLEHYIRALAVFEEMNNTINQCRCLRAIGAIHGEAGDHGLALEHMRLALDLATGAGNSIERAFALEGMGNTLIRVGEQEAALAALGEALDLAREWKLRSAESRICEALALVHEGMGNLGASIEMYRRHTAIEKGMRKEEVAREVERMRARYSLERAEREKSLLARKVRQLERELGQVSSELRTASRRLEKEKAAAERLRMDLLPFTHARGQDAATLARFLLERIDAKSVGEAEWHAFDGQFQRMHPSYVSDLLDRHGSLSRMELKICMLLRLNLTSKEIARVINLSAHTVDTHRRRIRRKLGLDGEKSLTVYLSSIG